VQAFFFAWLFGNSKQAGSETLVVEMHLGHFIKMVLQFMDKERALDMPVLIAVPEFHF
jgi:hypothetical protein